MPACMGGAGGACMTFSFHPLSVLLWITDTSLPHHLQLC